MSVGLPKPLHGWRIFLGEVGVIVLGVLLALGAQQAVQELQVRGEVSEFRRTIDHEIAFNVYVYDFRARQASCVTKRLEELDSWLENARNAAAVPSLRSERPKTYSVYRSAWDNRNASAFAHLPAKTRQKYAEFYDELENNIRMIALESDAWRALEPYAEPGPISLEDRRKVRSILGTARELNRLINSNLEFSRNIASELGVQKIAPDGIADEAERELAQCASVIGSSASASP